MKRTPKSAATKTSESRYLEHLGRRLKELRALKGMTQKDLAAELGVTPQYIHMIEAGRAKPSEQRLNDIARALGELAEEFMKTAVSHVEDEFATKLREAGLSPTEIDKAARRVSLNAKKDVVAGDEPLRVSRSATLDADLMVVMEDDEEIVALRDSTSEQSASPLDYARSVRSEFDVDTKAGSRRLESGRERRTMIEAGPRARIVVDAGLDEGQRRALEDIARVISHLLKEQS